jgi:hypothetical protein
LTNKTNKTNESEGRRRWLDRTTERPAWAESAPEPSDAADVETATTGHPEGWSVRLGRQVYEPVPERPGCWRETTASAALCTWCAEPVAAGDKVACPEHRRRLDQTVMPWETADREVSA